MYILLTGALIAVLVLLVTISLLCYCRLQYFCRAKRDDRPVVPFEINDVHNHTHDGNQDSKNRLVLIAYLREVWDLRYVLYYKIRFSIQPRL